MEELKNTDKKGISTKRKIGKTTYEVVVHFDENATETMQDKLTRIMLRELMFSMLYFITKFHHFL